MKFGFILPHLTEGELKYVFDLNLFLFFCSYESFQFCFQPRERFLHSAVTSDSHMFILGGRMYPWLANETFYAYSYNCNRWINLMAEGTGREYALVLSLFSLPILVLGIERVGVAPGQTFAQAMTIEPDGEAAYVVGGWGGDSQCSVYRIELPVDLCSLSPSKLNCLHIPGCAYCGRQEDDSFVSEEACHNNTDKCPIADVGYGKCKCSTVQLNGIISFSQLSRILERYATSRLCLAIASNFITAQHACKRQDVDGAKTSARQMRHVKWYLFLNVLIIVVRPRIASDVYKCRDATGAGPNNDASIVRSFT